MQMQIDRDRKKKTYIQTVREVGPTRKCVKIGIDRMHWVHQKLPQIYTVIAYTCIGKVARFAV